MPETFRFCPKVPRAISHDGKLTGHLAQAQQFIEIMSQLGTRLGPMFLQLPPHYSPGLFDDLKVFLEAWPSDVRLGVEVRHLDWFEDPHNQTLLEINLPFIEEWTRFLNEQLQAGSDVYLFCHSPENLIAPTLCQAFHRRIAANVSIPALPWDDEANHQLTQGNLF